MNNLNQAVEQELERFCAEARDRGARAVILFGSRAKKQYTEESDADVCLIADDLPEDLFRRRYPAPLGYRSLSVFGYHPEEFLRLLRQGNLFVLDIMHDGVILHDDSFLSHAREVYQETLHRYELQRTKRGWNWAVS